MSQFLFILIAVSILSSCQENTNSTPPKPQLTTDSNTINPYLLAKDAWIVAGTPLFDVEAYQEHFYPKSTPIYRITDSLKDQAHDFLYAFSQEEFISIYQDVLHKENHPRNSQLLPKPREMYDEFLYTQVDSFHIEVNRKGQGRVVKKPRYHGYIFDFITTYTRHPNDSFFQINALFFEKASYGTPKKWDDWYGLVTQGHLMCCATPTALATFHRTDSSLYTAESKLLKFPYFKRTEVLRTYHEDLLVRIDSTIFIYQFGIYKNPIYCDEKKFINGRLMTSFWQRRLKRKLRY